MLPKNWGARQNIKPLPLSRRAPRESRDTLYCGIQPQDDAGGFTLYRSIVKQSLPWMSESLAAFLKKEQKFVDNLWTEFSAHCSEALATDGKELQNP